jgi:hypothetical protein
MQVMAIRTSQCGDEVGIPVSAPANGGPAAAAAVTAAALGAASAASVAGGEGGEEVVKALDRTLIKTLEIARE